MAVPFFYIDDYRESQKEITLNEETSKHVVQVLRMQPGEKLQLTNGKGVLLTCTIMESHKKHCLVKVESMEVQPPPKRSITIAISLIKNANRFEWFLEKATEIGVSNIKPLICERTEKERFRFDRMQAIVVSAMLQSQQCWLPVLSAPAAFNELEQWKSPHGTNLIAHCLETQDRASLPGEENKDCLICIGPEGDFTPAEITLAIQHQFIPVTLGATRLRTETAGVVAAALLCIGKEANNF